MSISVDNVDHEILKKPQKWNLDFIKKFMLVFGPISSFFDFTTFFMYHFKFADA
jgi:Mg2+-importing ATPase